MKDQNKTKRQLIDELVKTRQQLEEYADILEAIPDIVYKIDPDGHFLYINCSVKDLGYSPEELIGKHFSEIIHPDDVASVSRTTALEKYKGKKAGDESSPKLFDERKTGKRVTKNLPIRLISRNWKKQKTLQNTRNPKAIRREVMASRQYGGGENGKDKTLTHVEISSSGQYDVEVNRTDKKHEGTVSVIRDISERIQLEQQKAKLEEQLQHSRRVQAIGQLVGGIAHDFNNLLMGIQGNVSLMLMDIDFRHPYYERLGNIERQIQSGAGLTSHLLGYARKGKYEVKPVDLNQLVEEVSDTFRRTRKEITIHRELADNLFTIEVDRGQIEQVLLNLFVNAADAMAGGGNLSLKTMNLTQKDMKGKLYDPKPGNCAFLKVT